MQNRREKSASGARGFGGGEGSKLLIVAGIISFAGIGAHAALVNRIIVLSDGDGGLHDCRAEEGTFFRLRGRSGRFGFRFGSLLLLLRDLK